MLTVTDMTGHEINELFPVDLNNLPYANTAHSAAAKDLDDLFQEKGAEAVTKDALEFLYPMKRLGFPYKSWFLPEGGECKDIATVVAKWYALTCAGTFSSYRGLCQTLIVLGKWLVNAFENTGDLFLFYIYPYILFYVIPYRNSQLIQTTIGQLNFFKWVIENDILEFIEQNYEVIEDDMNKRNSTSKIKLEPGVEGKTRKKREELSKSATKSIKKEALTIDIDFS